MATEEHLHQREGDSRTLRWKLPSSPQEQPSATSELVHEGELGHGEPFHEPPKHKKSRLPPGTRLVDILGAAFGRFWRTSHTVLRLELRRAIHLDGPTVQSESPRGSYHRNEPRRTREHADDQLDGAASSGWLQGIHGGGVQLKIMKIWEFPDMETGLPRLPWNLNIGLGPKIETERGGHLEMEARLKTKHLVLYILPLPLFELRGKWPIAGTRLAVNIRYRIPLLDLNNLWMSPTAQLWVNLYNPLGTGFHLTPGGLEFDEHVVNVGQHSTLRVAATIEFPRQFPLEEGEQPVRVHINRLGIKSRMS